MSISVYYFTGAGHSRTVAVQLGEALACPVCEIADGAKTHTSVENSAPDTAVVVFGVYCQHIPAPVVSFLRTLSCENVVLAATYGRISAGNVLSEASHLVDGTVIAGLLWPTGHTFLSENDVAVLSPDLLVDLKKRIAAPMPACIPKRKKDLFADLFPAWRSRVGVRLMRTKDCRACGVCTAVCPMDTMQNGIAGKWCIRCMRCVWTCPHHALHFANRGVLAWYLHRFYRRDVQAELFL